MELNAPKPRLMIFLFVQISFVLPLNLKSARPGRSPLPSPGFFSGSLTSQRSPLARTKSTVFSGFFRQPHRPDTRSPLTRDEVHCLLLVFAAASQARHKEPACPDEVYCLLGVLAAASQARQRKPARLDEVHVLLQVFFRQPHRPDTRSPLAWTMSTAFSGFFCRCGSPTGQIQEARSPGRSPLPSPGFFFCSSPTGQTLQARSPGRSPLPFPVFFSSPTGQTQEARSPGRSPLSSLGFCGSLTG